MANFPITFPPARETLARRVRVMSATPGARWTVTGPYALELRAEDVGALGRARTRARVAGTFITGVRLVFGPAIDGGQKVTIIRL